MPNIDCPAFKVVGSGTVLIVKGAPTPVEVLRGRPFVNDDFDVLVRELLEPLNLIKAGDFDENKHSRADDGKFGAGGGGPARPKTQAERNKAHEAKGRELIAAHPHMTAQDHINAATAMGESKNLTSAEHEKKMGHLKAATLRTKARTEAVRDARRKLSGGTKRQSFKSADVMLAWCDSENGGVEQLLKFIESTKPDVIISMSDEIEFEKSRNTWNLPTLEEIRVEKNVYGMELARKIVAINKCIDNNGGTNLHSVQLVEKGATPSDDSILTPIYKANSEKKIVYGVVLDPYQIDTQEDWIPPAEIEKTAHEFMKRSRVIGLHHKGTASDAFLVESSIEVYPSDSDRTRAMNNEPHRVYARKYGNDERVHSGAWVIGVQLSDKLWLDYKNGEIGAFSIEGFGERVPVMSDDMPTVTFVDIGEIGSGTNGRTDSKT